MRKKRWYDYLWIVECVYLALGFFNIFFAWLGVIFIMLPFLISLIGGSKVYCNKFCPRGLWFDFLGSKLRLSFRKKVPGFLRSAWFRYGFLIFFSIMFALMAYSTYRVFAGAPLKQTLTLFWAFNVPWHWAVSTIAAPWIMRFSFGLYGIMATSVIIGLVMNVIWKPRSWCVICPMGTITQGICKTKIKPD